MTEPIVRHILTFYGPGTYVEENTSQVVDSWDVDAAAEMAADITLRYGAKPYRFQFITRTNDGTTLDAKTTDRSPVYFIGGQIMTPDELEQSGIDYGHAVNNARANGWGRLFVTADPWLAIRPFGADDVHLLLEQEGAA